MGSARYEVLSTLPPGAGSRTKIAWQAGDSGFRRVVVMRQVPDGVDVEATVFAPQSVLPLLDLVELEGKSWAIYEFVPGATLGEVAAAHFALERLPSLGLIGRVVIDACRAIDRVHAYVDPLGLGVAQRHGGLSDGSIFVGFDGVTRVMDLGARRLGKFIAPEVTRGEGFGASADVFSLGAVLHHVATRFDKGYAATIARAPTAAEFPPLSAVHPEATGELDAVVMRALQLSPDVRFPSALELADALEAVLGTTLFTVPQVHTVMLPLFTERLAALRELVDPNRRSPPPVATDLEPEPTTSAARLAGRHPTPAAMPVAAPRSSTPRASGQHASLPAVPPRSSGLHASLPTAAPRSSGLHASVADAGAMTDAPSRPSAPKKPASIPPPVMDVVLDGAALGEIEELPTQSHKAPVDTKPGPPVPDAEPDEPAPLPNFISPPLDMSDRNADTSPALPDDFRDVPDPVSEPAPRPSAPKKSENTAARRALVPEGEKSANTAARRALVPEGDKGANTAARRALVPDEAEKARAKGQEKISTADLEPDELSPEMKSLQGPMLGEEPDVPTNIKIRPSGLAHKSLTPAPSSPRPRTSNVGLKAMPAATGDGETTTGEFYEDPKKKIPTAELEPLLTSAPRSGAAAKILIALLFVGVVGLSSAVVLRPDLAARLKARFRPAPPPSFEEVVVEEPDAGAPSELAPPRPTLVVAPAVDAGDPAAVGIDAGAAVGAVTDGGAEAEEDSDGGDEEEEEAVAPAVLPAVDAGAGHPGAAVKPAALTKKKKKHRNR